MGWNCTLVLSTSRDSFDTAPDNYKYYGKVQHFKRSISFIAASYLHHCLKTDWSIGPNPVLKDIIQWPPWPLIVGHLFLVISQCPMAVHTHTLFRKQCHTCHTAFTGENLICRWISWHGSDNLEHTVNVFIPRNVLSFLLRGLHHIIRDYRFMTSECEVYLDLDLRK